MSRTLAVVAAALLLVLPAGAGCSGQDGPAAGPTPDSASTGTTASAPSPAPPTATPAPTPPARACYRLRYAEAVAPTIERDPVDCARAHTAVTFAVGRLDAVVGGHLLAVDSDRVQAEVARACPQRMASFVGGSVDDRRLSMLRAVWFTPSVEASDAGASWYRCDVVALASDGRLASLTGKVAGILDRPADADRYAMCGTAEPGTKGFAPVVCSREHSWRAIAVVPLPDGRYPGADRARAAGQDPCRRAGAAVADSSLDYQWGYEWPSAAQWVHGQHFGRCWAPD